MKVRCLRILQGGRHDAPEVESHPDLVVGHEYVVLAVWADPHHGATYAILGEPPYGDYAILWAASMFEITSSLISPTWRARHPYEPPSPVVKFEPAAFDDAYHLARDGDDGPERSAAYTLWKREVVRMYEEEGMRPPTW